MNKKTIIEITLTPDEVIEAVRKAWRIPTKTSVTASFDVGVVSFPVISGPFDSESEPLARDCGGSFNGLTISYQKDEP